MHPPAGVFAAAVTPLKALLAGKHSFPRWPVRPPLEEALPEIVEKVSEELMAVLG